jgi:hypothetical protein
MTQRFSPEILRAISRMFAGQLPTRVSVPQPYEDDTFTLEGHEMRIIEQGRTDTLHNTSLHVPSIGLIIEGDVLYNKCHMFVGDTTAESRQNWIAALGRLAALNPAFAVAGHKKTGVPDTPDTIESSQRHLVDYDRLITSGQPDEQVYTRSRYTRRWSSSTRTGTARSRG